MDPALTPIPPAAQAARGAAQPGAIILARHGRPHADRTVRLNAGGYREWWAAYDTVGLYPGDEPPADVIAAAREADILIASGLPRAVATAKAVAPGREIGVDPLFIEAPLPPPPMPFQLKPPTWGVLSRIMWWLGYSEGGETRAQAEVRADKGAALLVDTARGGSSVMVFAHGWFNRMMRPALKRRGYVCVQDGGDAYWSFRTYLPQGAAFTLPAPADKVPANGDGA